MSGYYSLLIISVSLHLSLPPPFSFTTSPSLVKSSEVILSLLFPGTKGLIPPKRNTV